jgi:hypothetical protein
VAASLVSETQVCGDGSMASSTRFNCSRLSEAQSQQEDSITSIHRTLCRSTQISAAGQVAKCSTWIAYGGIVLDFAMNVLFVQLLAFLLMTARLTIGW